MDGQDPYYSVCRACLDSSPATTSRASRNGFVSLFDENGTNLEKFQLISGIDISSSQHDALMCRSCFQDLERAFELRKQIIEAETQHFQLKASEVYTFDIVEIDDEPEKFKIETVEIDSEEEPELLVERGSEDVKPDESHLNWMTMFDNGSSAGSDINEDPATESDKESTGTDEYLNTEIVTLSKRKRHSERDMVRSKGAGDDNSKECPVCKKVFRYNCEMRLHFESVHDKTISYKCSQCPKRSSHKAVIRRHLISHHKNSNNKSGAQKNRNNKSKTRPKTMPKTMPKTNTSITNHKFRCKVVGCQKYFLTLQELKDHKPIHAGSRPYECFCGTAYRKIQHLRAHKQNKHKLGVLAFQA